MVGKKLGHFRIVEKIGAGGMGVVYRARDERLHRDVALKLLPEGALADEQARKRFKREALALSQLNHPNIEIIHDFDRDQDTDFLVIELVEGETLEEKLRGGALAEREVVGLGLQLAQGLRAAHEHGVIHRDLKPANLRVTPEGLLKILDFGLARMERGPLDASWGASVTESGQVVGTLRYLAPEQLHGHAPDVRSDIYSAGAVLYEMATGGPLYPDVAPAQLLYLALNESPAPPRSVRPELSAGLESVIVKALDKDPGRRHQSAAELHDHLAHVAPAGLAEAGVAPHVTQPRHGPGWGSRRPMGLAAAVAVVAVASVLLLGQYRGCPGRIAASAIRSLAVLPFANLSGDASQEYFADGMTDELISTLSQVGALRVISRTSVMEYKAQRKPVREIARELKVQAVLEGSVRRFADRVKITVELIQAASERVMWGQSYERDLKDVLALQGEVASAIADQIRLKLTPQERTSLRRARPVNPAAYEQCLLGRQEIYAQEFTLSRVKDAFFHFRRAIEIDPQYANAYSGLGEAYYAISNYYVPPDSAMPALKAAATKALELDEGLAEGHALLGTVAAGYEWNWARAEREFRRAIELNPGAQFPHFIYGYYLVMTAGRLADAEEQLKIARDLDPLAGWVRWISGWPNFYRRDYDGAIRDMLQQADLDSTLWMPYSLLGEAHEMKGQLAKAVVSLRKARVLGGNPWVTAALARVYAKMGQRDSTARLLKELDHLSREVYVTPYGLATVQMALGNHDRAFALLEQALREHCEDLIFLRVDPRVDPLRSDPRFAALLTRLVPGS